MTYNKKQMQPLIEKYSINVETNKLFNTICEMFDGQPNYQLWAVRMVFSLNMTFDELKGIHDWILENGDLISELEKKNIVAYSNKLGIAMLRQEMEGLKMSSFVKRMVSNFNTKQKKMLMKYFFESEKEMKPISLYRNATLMEWYKIFKAFNKKPMAIKNKFYSSCSAVNEIGTLLQLIKDCLKASYSWDKDDLLSYMEYNTSDCDVVFNENNCVIVRVPSYPSSHKLCGSGRTGWCICREEGYFRNYVTSHSNRAQYFLFDFSRKESDAFAHIGFTVEIGRGIVEAQTCQNASMINPYSQGSERLSIHDVLKNFNIPMSTFMKLPSNIGYEFTLNAVLSIIDMRSGKAKNIGNNILIVETPSNDLLSTLLSKTFISYSSFASGNTRKGFIVFDFNLNLSNPNCILGVSFIKDRYGTFSIEKILNGLNEPLDKNYLKKNNLDESAFIKNNQIEPSIMLHKLIDENNEEEAIKLIESDSSVNVNLAFNRRIPVFGAMNNCMVRLFDAIVHHKNFDSTYKDGYGETLLEMLLYIYGNPEITTTTQDKTTIESMINSILSSETFDFNVVDYNNDTVVNVACGYLNEVWVVKILASMPNIDINVVNDFDCSPLTNCIRNKNLEALKIIGSRPDLKVREEDKNMAKAFNIDLSKYIKPSDSIFGKYPRPKREELFKPSNVEEELFETSTAEEEAWAEL